MKILRNIAELATLNRPVCLAIGVFDGVHRGHQALIQAVQQEAVRRNAMAIIVTFDPHPLKVLRKEDAPRLITSTQHKLKIFEKLNVEAVLIISFTDEFSKIPPEQFIEALVKAAQPLTLIAVGYRWEFGYRRSGNVELLIRLGKKWNFEVLELPPVIEDKDLVSSTRIRQAIRDGNLQQAELLLGRPFSLFGKVVRGEGLGRELGFPTINLDYEGEKIPPNGVYGGRCEVLGQNFPAAINVGNRPTVNRNHRITVEAYLIGFEGNLYGQEAELFFLRFLRMEQRFESLEALRFQIEKDISNCFK